MGLLDRIKPKVKRVAINRPDEVPAVVEGTSDTDQHDLEHVGVPQRKHASREQTAYWRRVPTINVLPSEKRQLPANLILRGMLAVGIGLLLLVAADGYLGWNDIKSRSAAAEIQSQTVKRQLAARQSEIEPLQSEINLLTSNLESAETTYRLATAEQADWFTAMSGLFSISVTGVDFISAAVDSRGAISFVGIATNSDAITSLPTELSQLAGIVDLQGIQWDAEVSPPVFTAEFRVNR